MSSIAMLTKSPVIPCLRYRDAPAAMEWLCETFGFRKQLVVPHQDGSIAHAQLCLGHGMIMLDSAIDSGHGLMMKQPEEIGGATTQSLYVVVSDPDSIYERAKAAGAAIAIEISDKDYGGRGFTCRDLEGHLWSFGSYDPYQEG